MADSRLRIKGRFISKKDCEKIKKLVGGRQEEAFNERKNLNMEFINSKLNLSKNEKSSKNEILNKIDEVLSRKNILLNKDCAEKIINKIKEKKPVFFIDIMGLTELKS